MLELGYDCWNSLRNANGVFCISFLKICRNAWTLQSRVATRFLWRTLSYRLTIACFLKVENGKRFTKWLSNQKDCWHALPSDAKQVANIDGYKDYQFKDLIELIYVQKRCRKSMQIMINCRMAIIVINWLDKKLKPLLI